jgi:hypothetical protein
MADQSAYFTGVGGGMTVGEGSNVGVSEGGATVAVLVGIGVGAGKVAGVAQAASRAAKSEISVMFFMNGILPPSIFKERKWGEEKF